MVVNFAMIWMMAMYLVTLYSCMGHFSSNGNESEFCVLYQARFGKIVYNYWHFALLASRKDWNSPFVGLSEVMLFDDLKILNYLVPIKLI